MSYSIDTEFNHKIISKSIAGYDRFKYSMTRPEHFKIIIYDHNLYVTGLWTNDLKQDLSVGIKWVNTGTGVYYKSMRTKVINACKKWSKLHGFKDTTIFFEDRRKKHPNFRVYKS